jgi:hypothetical protein
MTFAVGLIHEAKSVTMNVAIPKVTKTYAAVLIAKRKKKM